MRHLVPLIALSLFAVGCEDGTPEQTTTPVRAANTVSDQLKGMSELYRYLGLRRAVMDSGYRCKKVDRGAYQEEYKTMALWTAHCTDSGDWAIFIAPNADIQVRRCKDMDELSRQKPDLKLPMCRQTGGPSSGTAPKAS